jgi:hypothetical protein
MNAQKENQIAWMLVLGVGMSLGGVFVSFIAIVLRGSAILFALGPIMFLAGILLAGWGIFSGHIANRRADAAGSQFIPNCYVVGRFEVNSNGEMIFSDFDYDAPKSKFIVRLKLPDGSDQEYECASQLLDQIGEGMIGNVQIRGRWLGSFTPVPRA